ncbi:glutathione S-transferase family protein [Roseibium algae]|uniref:Glutathione S-transferase N-terminal domain-containing protein n=1 Tax=Roseibium algae TaxID=3123038 RepID=A0ABU8TFR1_9HYPH
MTDPTNEIILHNYPQSPVAEKVRVGLGIKGLSWASVEIPRLPPKPMLTQLTGGYRRTPVMQIGADIYCDSQAILRELERHHPSPSFFPNGNAGLMWALSRWTDGALFDLTVKIVLGSAGDALPKDFAEDRGRLYLGADWSNGLKAANADLPHLVSQMRAPLSWLEAQLSDGRAFLAGDAAGAIDAQFFHVVWFLRGRFAGGPNLLSEFPRLERWEENVTQIGHGTMTDLSAEDALERASTSSPRAIDGAVENDPEGLSKGMAVVVSPDLDGGEQPVSGTLVAASADTITIHREDHTCGDLHVHFPRAGYRIAEA